MSHPEGHERYTAPPKITSGLTCSFRKGTVAALAEPLPHAWLDRERMRRCLGSLTRLQCESVTLAYCGGYTFREVAPLLACRGER